MKKFYPREVIGKRYSMVMLHYIAYLFPDKKFSIREFDMYHAMFIKGWDEGYATRVIEESEGK